MDLFSNATDEKNKVCYKIKVQAPFATYKKPYATSSQPSFYLPPLTTLMGMFSAILGIPRDKYYNLFNDVRFSLQIISPVLKKTVQNLNLVNNTEYFKTGIIKVSAQIPTELVLDSEFYVYMFILDLDKFLKGISNVLSHNFQLEDLEDIITNSKTVFSLNLGKAFNLASYKFINKYKDFKRIKIGEEIKEKEVYTVVNPALNNVKLNGEGSVIFYEKDIPAEFDYDEKKRKRILKSQYNLVFSVNNSLTITSGYVFQLEENEFVTLMYDKRNEDA